MRTQHLFLSILFGLLVSFPAIASDWVFIQSNKSIISYIDKESIKGNTASIKFWTKTVFKKEQVDPLLGIYSTRIEYVEIDCNNSILKLHEMNYFSRDGALVNQIRDPRPDVHRIIPDSVGAVMEKYVCGFKQTK